MSSNFSQVATVASFRKILNRILGGHQLAQVIGNTSRRTTSPASQFWGYRFSSACIGLGLTGILISGCSNDQVTNPYDQVANDKEARYERDYPGERHFRQLAQDIPGFAGFAYEPGTANVVDYLTDSTSAGVSAARVNRLFDEPRKWGRVGRPQIKTKIVKYSFVMLENLRDRTDAELSKMTGIVSLDIDEAKNRLTINVNGATARANVELMMHRQHFEEDSYIVQDDIECDFAGNCFPDGDNAVDPNSSDYSSTAPLSLHSLIRPLEAGTEMNVILLNPTRELACTIGFAGNSSFLGAPTIVTAAHCSKRHGYQDHANYYQPASKWNGVSQTAFAQEVFDPPFEPCDTLLCRGSDALIASTSQAVSARIARPQGPPGGLLNGSSLLIDANNPYFPVTDTDDPILNETVDKVGEYSGWTHGIVHTTCEVEYIGADPLGANIRRS